MSFISARFLMLFPIFVILYRFLYGTRMKKLGLLAASCAFYLCASRKLAVVLAAAIIITYAAGLCLERTREHPFLKKASLIVAICCNFSFLVVFKYAAFLLNTANILLGKFSLSLPVDDTFSLALPLGLPYYTFKSAGYLIDVYRGKIDAEHNLIDFALFISFFLELIVGPIDRASNLLPQIKSAGKPSYSDVKNGALLMIWGYFLKMVLADRIGLLVDTVYGDIYRYAGFQVLLAVFGYSIQLYTDFAGCSAIAIGAGEALGFRLPENFRQPYLALSVADFWRRWHMSLTGWFRDYLYIPLGGNRKGTVRKWINVIIVFLASGLWHGAGFHYLIWGGINGVYQCIGGLLQPIRDNLVRVFHIDRETFGHRLYKRFTTFSLVSLAFVFFRAESVHQAFAVLRQLVRSFNVWIFFDLSVYQLGLDQLNVMVLLGALTALFLVDVKHEQGLHLRQALEKQPFWFRLGVYVLAVCTIVVFGIYGTGYDAASFIYGQF